MDVLTITGLIVALIFFLLGILGTIIPMLPGAPLIWTGMLLYGLITGFDNLTPPFFLFQALLALAVLLVDHLTTLWGTRRFGGSRAGFWGAVLGLLLGALLFNLAGLLPGTFLGAVLGELTTGKGIKQAFLSGTGAVLGFLGGLPFKLLLEIIMIAWFFLSIF